MEEIMTPDKIDNLVRFNLYHLKHGKDLQGKSWVLAIPNYAYCRTTAPIYEQENPELKSSLWFIWRGKLQDEG